MSKTKTAKAVFMCGACGNEFAKWEGRCTHCGEWNTISEVPAAMRRAATSRAARPEHALGGGAAMPVVLTDVEETAYPRITTGIAEFDFVLGGGVVPGGIVLLGGEPGIGKSTILTQVSARLREADRRVLYVSGEESAHQVKLRAQRLGGAAAEVTFLGETEVGAILGHAAAFRPHILIVDSIQTIYAAEVEGQQGNPSQIRECAARLQRYAKDQGVAIFVVGQVTKGGELGGPKLLEHIVDTVIYFEEAGGDHRIMRATKNRFGSVDEIGVFRMTEQGLEPVANPSELFLADRSAGSSGSAVTAVIEGTRPVLVEVQGLVTLASYGSPQRVATGYPRARLALLVAVLEKRMGLAFSTYDAFLNVAGGLALLEPAADAAVVAALASSAWDRPLPDDALFLGEVGLGGELRRVGQVERRLAEAAKQGFRTVYLAERSLPRHTPAGLRVIGVDSVASMLEHALAVTPKRGPAPAEVDGSAARERRGARGERQGARTALALGTDGN